MIKYKKIVDVNESTIFYNFLIEIVGISCSDTKNIDKNDSSFSVYDFIGSHDKEFTFITDKIEKKIIDSYIRSIS